MSARTQTRAHTHKCAHARTRARAHVRAHTHTQGGTALELLRNGDRSQGAQTSNHTMDQT